jgi:hypothetical protein
MDRLIKEGPQGKSAQGHGKGNTDDAGNKGQWGKGGSTKDTGNKGQWESRPKAKARWQSGPQGKVPKGSFGQGPSGSGHSGRKPLPPGRKELSKEELSARMTAGQCFQCGKQGHLARDCPSKGNVK